ncbi:hypothetical protein L7F22_059175 [Adiantum nelumboides]|nr:hypothetical protein [Adiantum nelumboides]
MTISTFSAAHSLLLSLVAISLLIPAVHCSKLNVRDSNSTSAYEILEDYGFPAGLLPYTVSSYELDDDDGAFKLYLESACTVNIPNLYPIKYKSTITGYLTSGKISSLSGITVKVLFIWWSITSISVSGENLVFKVGPTSASYAMTNFDENPVCASSYPFLQLS